MWQKTKTGSKAGFDKLWSLADKLGAPVNRLSNKLGSEAFWPTTLDKESDKAARILRSFCKDGFYEEETVEAAGQPKGKQRVLKKIPAQVIKEARGLAIFTTMRTGLWVSGAGGSGVLVARLPDGTWSPPSGILLHTAGVGFLVGVDIYDCVIVINSDSALAAFSKVRCTVGTEISAVAGPVGMGGVVESEVHNRRAPIFTYLKSRGFYAGVQLDGTIVIERTDENERFYHRRIPVADILAGKIGNPPHEAQKLIQTLKAAQGDTDVDPMMLTLEPPPSDFDIADGQTFGIPDKDDPDPYGVLALEKEGLEIREAGTKQPASRNSFQFSPSPTSPLFHAFNRNSIDGAPSRRSSWRTTMTDRSVQTVDMSTQTDLDLPSPSPRPQSASYRSSMANIPELEVGSIDGQLNKTTEPEPEKRETQVSSSKVGLEEPIKEEAEHSTTGLSSTENGTTQSAERSTDPTEIPQNRENDSDADDEDDEEEAVIHEFKQAASSQFITASPQVISKARLVTVVKPPPPALPPRNPIRQRQAGSVSPSREPVGDGSETVEDRPASNLFVAPVERPTSSSSSVYSTPNHDQPSSARTSETAGSISSIDHHEAILHTVTATSPEKLPGDETRIVASKPAEAQVDSKPTPPVLPPRTLPEVREAEV